jgi:hypothetical protein
VVKALLEKLSRHLVAPEPVSQIPVKLEKSGALSVDVEDFLSSPQGKKDLKRAQELWEQSAETAHGA